MLVALVHYDSDKDIAMKARMGVNGRDKAGLSLA